MNQKQRNFLVKCYGALLLSGVATAQQDTQPYYLDSKDELTLSLRFGLNFSGKFSGVAGPLNSANPFVGNRLTPNGDPYNYDNGYVLKDISGNAGNQTDYYGFDNNSQVTGTAGVQQSLNLNRTTLSGISGSQNDPVYDPRIGAELTYNHLLGIKENWHHLRFGLELAANYTPIDFDSTTMDQLSATVNQYSYAFAPGTTAPPAPFQGTYMGPGPNGSSYAILGATPTLVSSTSSGGYQFLSQDNFRGDLWGFRLGPYLEMPLSRRLSLHLSGGLAVGLLDDNAWWSQTLTPPAGGGAAITASGSGSDLSVLWGGYARLDASWQLNRHWGVEVGAQFQDLGNYNHDFGGRSVDVDLSRSIFVEAGLSYTF